MKTTCWWDLLTFAAGLWFWGHAAVTTMSWRQKPWKVCRETTHTLYQAKFRSLTLGTASLGAFPLDNLSTTHKQDPGWINWILQCFHLLPAQLQERGWERESGGLIWFPLPFATLHPPHWGAQTPAPLPETTQDCSHLPSAKTKTGIACKWGGCCLSRWAMVTEKKVVSRGS